LEKLKIISTNYSDTKTQILCQDISKLIFSFIFSTVSELRFEKCKSLLGKLENIEKSLRELLVEEPVNRSYGSIASSYYNDSVHVNSGDSLKTLKDTVADTRESFSPVSRRTSIMIIRRNSLKVAFPGGNDEDLECRSDYKQLSIITGQLKYIMAQIGHLLHYDRLSNPITEMVTKRIEQWENRKTARASIFGATPASQGADHGHVFTSTNTIINSSPSIEQSPINRLRTLQPITTPINADHIFSKNSFSLKDYFYNAHNFLNDFEEEIQEKRKDQLKKYAKWKATKWVKKNQRIKLEKKHSEQKIICKICARDIKTNLFKDHSSYCRKQGEIEKALKKQEKKLAEVLHKASMKAKNYHTKVILLSKSYYKLRDKFGSPTSRKPQFRGFTVINNPVTSTSQINSASGSPQFSLSSSHRGSPDWSRNSNSVKKSRPRQVRNLLKTFTSPPHETSSQMHEISFADKTSQHADESFNYETPDYTNSNSHSPFTSPETQRRSHYALNSINSSPEDHMRKLNNSCLLAPSKNPLLNPSDEAELLSPLSPQLNPKGRDRGLFVIKSKKKKKKVKEGKTKVNEDVNYNFYSDPAKSENGSGNSTDSRISIESILSTRYIQNRNRFDDSLNVSRNDSFTSLDRGNSTERSPPHLATPQVHKKSHFARFNTVIVASNQDEKRKQSIEAVSEEENLENNLLDLELSKQKSEIPKLSPLFLDGNEKEDDLPSGHPGSAYGTTMHDESESRQGGDPTVMEMIKLRTEISAKKMVKETFDFIVAKGKILLNQGSYQRSMFL